jgi:hypothetical protein
LSTHSAPEAPASSFWRSITASLLILIFASIASAAPIERIWLSYQTDASRSLVINWETSTPSNSRVDFGPTAELGQTKGSDDQVKLHHVEIPLPDGPTYYRVHSGTDSSAIHQVATPPTDELRVAVVADLGYKKSPWADAIFQAKPHLLLTAGDNVPALHTGTQVAPDSTTAFSQLIDQSRQLFSTTPFLPILGNHDREIRPRGPQPPPEPVYDVEATAFRSFFALPGNEWHWQFDIPRFGVRFIALDMSHLQDHGTTWQTNHSFDRDSVQFGWYRDLIAASKQPFVVTLYNERNSKVRGLEAGEWGRMISQGSLAITGFGYFAERADVDGFAYYNTSISGTGDRYPDLKSVFLKSEHNFLLLTFHREPAALSVEFKNLSGDTLDRKEFLPRRIPPK